MDFLQYIPILELLFFNLFSIYRCCHKKYSVVKTIFVLALFSAAMFLFFLIFAEQFSFRGDGSMSLGGFSLSDCVPSPLQGKFPASLCHYLHLLGIYSGHSGSPPFRLPQYSPPEV